MIRTESQGLCGWLGIGAGNWEGKREANSCEKDKLNEELSGTLGLPGQWEWN